MATFSLHGLTDLRWDLRNIAHGVAAEVRLKIKEPNPAR